MHAPNLTGLGASYLTRQLRLFRDRRRGNENDQYGFMMIGRADSLPGDRGVRDVAAYIDSLDVISAGRSGRTDSWSGDPQRGRTLFTTCVACHGEHAEGRVTLGGSALRQLDAGYLFAQLENFRTHVRGSAVDDLPGKQMQSAVGTLKSESDVRDVVAYILAL